jgi:hypothetical protein
VETQTLSALLLIAGFTFLLLGFVFGLGTRIYGTMDMSERERIVEENKTRWNITQFFAGLGLLLMSIGFAVLASRLRTDGNSWIPTLGGTAIILGALSGTYFLYRQTTDMVGAFSGQYPGFEPAANILTLIGLLLFGIAFLQAGLPGWLGYLTIGLPLAYGLTYLVTGSGWLTPGISTLLGLLIAIILLWQKPLP